MMAALLWLTVSTPFVNASLQQMAQQNTSEQCSFPFSSDDDDSSNPFGTSNEEKAPGNNTLTEEYLHDHHKPECVVTSLQQYRKMEDERAYIAYHGELLVPPPNVA